MHQIKNQLKQHVVENGFKQGFIENVPSFKDERFSPIDKDELNQELMSQSNLTTPSVAQKHVLEFQNVVNSRIGKDCVYFVNEPLPLLSPQPQSLIKGKLNNN